MCGARILHAPKESMMLKFEDIDLDRMVEEVLAGKEIARETAAAVLNCPDDRLADLLAATRRVREAAFGRRVKICMLRNAQSGICPEDCSYCSQSRISKAEIPGLQDAKRRPIGRGRANGGRERGAPLLHGLQHARSGAARCRASGRGVRSNPRRVAGARTVPVDRPDESRAGGRTQERGRRMDKSQPQHQPPLLSGNLHDAHL